MNEIAGMIHAGAMAFLKTESYLAVFIVVVFAAHVPGGHLTGIVLPARCSLLDGRGLYRDASGHHGQRAHLVDGQPGRARQCS